jgi:hypothetical protein
MVGPSARKPLGGRGLQDPQCRRPRRRSCLPHFSEINAVVRLVNWRWISVIPNIWYIHIYISKWCTMYIYIYIHVCMYIYIYDLPSRWFAFQFIGQFSMIPHDHVDLLHISQYQVKPKLVGEFLLSNQHPQVEIEVKATRSLYSTVLEAQSTPWIRQGNEKDHLPTTFTLQEATCKPHRKLKKWNAPTHSLWVSCYFHFLGETRSNRRNHE